MKLAEILNLIAERNARNANTAYFAIEQAGPNTMLGHFRVFTLFNGMDEKCHGIIWTNSMEVECETFADRIRKFCAE